MATIAKMQMYIFVVSVFCVTIAESLSRPSTMVFENNQFKNVVIALHDSIAEDRNLINTLKDTMIKASKSLYTATRRRAYFKEITILLPSSWTPDASYSAHTNETINMADVVISNPSRSVRSLPQARSYAGCGKQGVHVFLTQEFLTSIRSGPFFGDPAKYFIHAFAQFRWGVFQEYSEEGETEFYFSLTSGFPEAIRCVYYLRGLVQKFDANHTICYPQIYVDPNTGLYPPECKWRPYPIRQRVKASIMDHQWIQAIETFCDDETGPSRYLTVHNYEAPSKHNRLCGHRSTWAVITETNDFNNNANLPVNLTDAELTPSFKIVRAPTRRKRAVFLCDTSAVHDDGRLSEIHRRIGHALHDLADDTYDIGVAQFGGMSSASIPIRRIRSTDDVISVTRELMSMYTTRRNVTFEDALDNVLKDVEKLDDKDDAVGDLVIVTNREKLTDDRQLDIREYAKDRGLDVHMILVNSDEIGTLPSRIGKIYHEGRSVGSSVTDHIRHILLADEVADIHAPVVIKHLHTKATEPELTSGRVEIDPSIGKNTIFTFTYTTETPDVKLTSPSGEWYDTQSTHCSVDTDLRMVKFVFQLAEPGSWTYEIRVTPGNDLEMSVTSLHRTDIHDDPIVIKTGISSAMEHVTLFADVTSGIHPVIGLNVSATVTSPGGKVSEVVLLDKGAGADIANHDGVYSRYFTKLDETGVYHVTVVATGTHGAVFIKTTDVDFTHDRGHFKKSITSQVVPGNISRHAYAGIFLRTSNKQGHVNNIQPISKHQDSRIQVENGAIDNADTDITEMDDTGAMSGSSTEHVSDVIPPCRIQDLVVSGLLPYRHTVVLAWTAPGDDMDTGQVDHYELFVGQDIKDVRDVIKYSETGTYDGPGRITIETHPVILEANNEELLLWQPDTQSRGNVYVFAIRGVDMTGQKAEISNIVAASLQFRT